MPKPPPWTPAHLMRLADCYATADLATLAYLLLSFLPLTLRLLHVHLPTWVLSLAWLLLPVLFSVLFWLLLALAKLLPRRVA